MRELGIDGEDLSLHRRWNVGIESGPGNHQHARQLREGVVTSVFRAAVPGRIEYLRPLVGAHHHDVVPACDVGDELVVDDTGAEPGTGLGGPFDRGHARVDRRLTLGVLAQRRAREIARSSRSRSAAARAASAIARCATVSGSNEPG